MAATSIGPRLCRGTCPHFYGLGFVTSALFRASSAGFCEAIITVAASLSAIGFEAIWAVLAEMFSRVQSPEASQEINGFKDRMARKPSQPASSAMSGYADLLEKSPEEQESLKQTQKAELKALYRSRVLGQPEPTVKSAGQ